MKIDPPKKVKIPVLIQSNENNIFTIQNNTFWEISVPSTDSLEWCIMLSLLKSCNLNSGTEFANRLKTLTLEDKSVSKVKKAIKKFNPFLNRYSSFYKSGCNILENVVSEFKEKVNKYNADQRTDCKKLMCKIGKLCSLTNCCVMLISELGKNDFEQFTCHAPNFDSYSSRIILKHDSTDQNTFRFLLKKSECTVLRKAALSCILRRTDLSEKERRRLLKMFAKNEDNLDNFVIFLLQSHLVSPILKIYKYSYITDQLASAGFQTDPRILDCSERSVFYYASLWSNKELVYILYKYAANACHATRMTYRNPDPKIVSNLFDLRAILKNDCSKLKDESNWLHGLRNFNEFLLRLNQQLLKHFNEINYNENNDDEEFIRRKQSRKMSSILKAYSDNSWLNTSEDTVHASCFEIEDFLFNKFYYNLLDYTASLFFFDNVFILKRSFKLPFIHLYTFELESSFLFLLLSYKHLSCELRNPNAKYENYLEIPSLAKNVNRYRFLNMFHVIERYNLLEQVTEFCNNLEVSQDKSQRKSCKIPVEIKDEFMISRMKYYSNIAVEAKYMNKKSVLSIQRALQVLGESLKFEWGNPDSFSHLLRDCLPEGIADVLNDIRNALSHCSREKFIEKFIAEKDADLFLCIRAEIKEIIKRFKIVFETQQKRLVQFLVKRWKKLLEKVKTNTEEGKIDQIKLDSTSISELEKWYNVTMPCDPIHDNYLEYFEANKVNRQLTEIGSTKFDGLIKFKNLLLTEDMKKRTQHMREKMKQSITHRRQRSLSCIENSSESCAPENKILDSDNAIHATKHSKINEKEDLLEEVIGRSYFGSPLSENKFSLFTNTNNKINELGNESYISDNINIKLEHRSNTEANTSSNIKELEQSSNIHGTKLVELQVENTIQNSLTDVNNFLNRIQLLENFMLDDKEIRNLHEKGHSPKAQELLIAKIANRYLTEADFQASMEILLFDCITILEGRRPKLKNGQSKNRRKVLNNLGYLWHKTRKLYHGINMRNVLAHGHIFLETLSDFLDPDDFSSELARKLMQFVKDKEVIEAMGYLWASVNGNEVLFQSIVENPQIRRLNPEQRIMGHCIQKCDHWKDYYSTLLKDITYDK